MKAGQLDADTEGHVRSRYGDTCHLSMSTPCATSITPARIVPSLKYERIVPSHGCTATGEKPIPARAKKSPVVNSLD